MFRRNKNKMSVSSGSDVTIPIQDSPPPPPSPYANRNAGENGNEERQGKTPEPRGDVVVGVGEDVGIDNEAYHHQSEENKEDKDSKGPHHTQITMNGSADAPPLNEALNSELINLNILNTIPDKPQPEFGPYDNFDEYFIPVNQHKKFLRRSEKLYVTKDKRKESQWKKYACWIVGAFILATIVTIAVLAGVGLIPQKSSSSLVPDSVVATTIMSSKPDQSSTTTEHQPPPSTATTSVEFATLSSTTTQSPVMAPDDSYVPNSADVEFHITDLSYEAALNDKTTDRFKELSSEIEQEMKTLLKNDAGLDSAFARVSQFSPGSVLVKMRVGWVDEHKNVKDVQKFLAKLTSFGGYSIRAVSSYDVVNHCKFNNNNGCSHYCTFDYESLEFLCTCPESMLLETDKKTCSNITTPDLTPSLEPENETGSGSESSFEDETPSDSEEPETTDMPHDPQSVSHSPEDNIPIVVSPDSDEHQISSSAAPELEHQISSSAAPELEHHIASSPASELEQSIASSASPEFEQPISSSAASEIEQPIASSAATELEQPIASSAASEIEQPIVSSAATELEQPISSSAASEIEQPIASSAAPELEQPISSSSIPELEQPISSSAAPEIEQPIASSVEFELPIASSSSDPELEQSVASSAAPETEHHVSSSATPELEQPIVSSASLETEQHASSSAAPELEQPIVSSAALETEHDASSSAAPELEHPIASSATSEIEQPIVSSAAPEQEQPIVSSAVVDLEQPIASSAAPETEQHVSSSAAPELDQPIASSSAPEIEPVVAGDNNPEHEHSVISSPAPELDESIDSFVHPELQQSAASSAAPEQSAESSSVELEQPIASAASPEDDSQSVSLISIPQEEQHLVPSSSSPAPVSRSDEQVFVGGIIPVATTEKTELSAEENTNPIPTIEENVTQQQDSQSSVQQHSNSDESAETSAAGVSEENEQPAPIQSEPESETDSTITPMDILEILTSQPSSTASRTTTTEVPITIVEGAEMEQGRPPTSNLEQEEQSDPTGRNAHADHDDALIPAVPVSTTTTTTTEASVSQEDEQGATSVENTSGETTILPGNVSGSNEDPNSSLQTEEENQTDDPTGLRNVSRKSKTGRSETFGENVEEQIPDVIPSASVDQPEHTEPISSATERNASEIQLEHLVSSTPSSSSEIMVFSDNRGAGNNAGNNVDLGSVGTTDTTQVESNESSSGSGSVETNASSSDESKAHEDQIAGSAEVPSSNREIEETTRYPEISLINDTVVNDVVSVTEDNVNTEPLNGNKPSTASLSVEQSAEATTSPAISGQQDSVEEESNTQVPVVAVSSSTATPTSSSSVEVNPIAPPQHEQNETISATDPIFSVTTASPSIASSSQPISTTLKILNTPPSSVETGNNSNTSNADSASSSGERSDNSHVDNENELS